MLHPVHAATVVLTFRLYITGYSVNQIAIKLTNDGTRIVGDKLKAHQRWHEWRSSKIAEILRDGPVLGYVQPHKMVDGKRVAPPGARRSSIQPESRWMTG